MRYISFIAYAFFRFGLPITKLARLLGYIVLCGAPFYTKANIHIEPYGSIGGAYSSSVRPSASSSFFMHYVLGGRLGYDLSLVKVGVDVFWTYYDIGSNDPPVEVHHTPKNLKGFEQAGTSLGIEADRKHTAFTPLSIGVWTAVDLPFLISAYGSLFYALGGKKDFLNHRGYGLKVGASWLAVTYFQLNAEVKWAYYMCQKDPQCSPDFPVLSASISVSVPLSFNPFSSEDLQDSKEAEEDNTEGSGQNVASSTPPSEQYP